MKATVGFSLTGIMHCFLRQTAKFVKNHVKTKRLTNINLIDDIEQHSVI